MMKSLNSLLFTREGGSFEDNPPSCAVVGIFFTVCEWTLCCSSSLTDLYIP